MFSHRLTQFVWHIWRKYRYHISFRNGGVDAFSQRMYSLVGLGHRQLRDKLAINHSKMLAYSGILANPGRSPEIICGLVSHCFDLSEVTLQNWQRRKVDIEPDQQNSLGSYSLKNGEKLAGRSVLGNFVLGTRVPDLSGKFQLSITSLTRKQFLSFLPSGENFLPLTMFVSFILRDQLAWDLHLGLTGINRDRLQQDFVQWTQESAESVVPDADGKGAGTMTDASDTLLARYAKNMTADARNGRLDPVLCRDHEIDLMIDILCRRRKNNPVVVGEAGVGKSALIEGLALRIVAGQVPDKLKNTDIMTLDLGALQAGASVKGEFEKRFKGLMAEVISSPVPVILFIDEAHTLPGLPEMKVEVRSLTENPPQASVIKQGSTVRGFIAGIACSVAVASALWWWQVYPVQQQLLQVNDTAQGAATVWMASPELENYERRLQQLLDTSPVQPLETGMQMMRVADSRWPESLQQQQASTQWNEALKTRAQSSPQLRGWLQTRQDLHAFADLVMQREKEGLTLSYIINVIWQAERGLGQETPVESLLTQYHDARAQKQNTDALEKQINERLEGVLSRWLLLKNNVMPEAATGTTAEK